MTAIALLLAHGGGAVRMVVGSCVGLPLALAATVVCASGLMTGPRHKRIRLGLWMSWIALIWNAGGCVLILSQEGLPTPGYGEGYKSYLTSGWVEYVEFFGPSTALSVFSMLTCHRIHTKLAKRKRLIRTCEKCAYSLEGLQTARCPECGTPFDPDCWISGDSPWMSNSALPTTPNPKPIKSSFDLCFVLGYGLVSTPPPPAACAPRRLTPRFIVHPSAFILVIPGSATTNSRSRVPCRPDRPAVRPCRPWPACS